MLDCVHVPSVHLQCGWSAFLSNHPHKASCILLVQSCLPETTTFSFYIMSMAMCSGFDVSLAHSRAMAHRTPSGATRNNSRDARKDHRAVETQPLIIIAAHGTEAETQAPSPIVPKVLPLVRKLPLPCSLLCPHHVLLLGVGGRKQLLMCSV